MSEIPDNPFTPGIGELPPVMGHRSEIETHLLRMLRELRKGRAHAKFAILYGPRGNGKTVLLTWLENQAAGESITCASLMPENLQTDGALARALEAAAGHPAIVRKILQSLDFTISAGLAGVSAQLGARDNETDPAQQIARTPLLIMLDEAHRVVPSQLARLMDAVQAAGETSPVALVLAGTPGLEDTQRASGASYWSRAAQLAVGLLPPAEAKRAVAEPFRHAGISLTDKVATSLAAAADHYPYFLQLYGAVAWDAVTAAGTWHPGPEQMAVATEIGHAKRQGYYSDRYEEFSDARALPLARAVALAFQEHDECLDDAQLNAVLDQTAAGGTLETPDARRLLRAHGYIWRPQPGADWEPGNPSLMDYMIAKTEPVTHCGWITNTEQSRS